MKHKQPIYECLYNKHLFLKGRTLENSLYRVILTSLQWSFLRDSSSHLILTQLHAKISSITVTYLTADQRCMYNPRIHVPLRKPKVQSIMVRSRKPWFYFSCGIVVRSLVVTNSMNSSSLQISMLKDVRALE